MADLSQFISGGVTATPEDEALRKPSFQAPASELGSFIRGSGNLEKAPLSVAADNAQDQNPEQAAKVLRLQAKTGLPAEVIKTNFEQVSQQSSRADFNAEEFRTKSPLVAGWLAENPQHFAASKDDLDSLSTIEALTRTLSGGFDAGRKGAMLGRATYDSIGKTLTAEQKQGLSALEKEVASSPFGHGFLATYVLPAAKFIGGMSDTTAYAATNAALGASMGATIGLAGGPASPLSVPAGALLGGTAGGISAMAADMFKIGAGTTYLQLSKIKNTDGAPISENIKMGTSIFTGLVGAGLQLSATTLVAAPYKAAVDRFISQAAIDVTKRATIASAMGKFGEAYATGVAGMTAAAVLTEATNVMGEEMAKMASNGQFQTMSNDPDYRAAVYERLAEAGSEAFRGMLVIGAPGAALHMTPELVQARQANARADVYKALGENIANSKTFERLPEKMQEIVSRLTKDGPLENVYIDAPAFEKYFQAKGVDPLEAARQIWGDTHEYELARDGEQSMRLPMADYAAKIAPTDHNVFFADELRRSPDEMNAREAKDYAVQTEAQHKAIQEELASRTAEVEAKVTEQLVKAGYEQKTAETIAKQNAEFFGAQAQRLGNVDPMKLFEYYGLQVERPELAPDGSMKQSRPVLIRSDYQGKSGPLELKEGMRIYHGAHDRRAESIEADGHIKARPEFKSGGGTLDEGGLTWFGDYLLADRHAKSEVDSIASQGRETSGGKVFEFTLGRDFKLIDKTHKLTANEASKLNEALGIPEYKRIKEGDAVWQAVYRAFDSGRKDFEKIETDRGSMKVIWPEALKALGFDGYYDDSGIALARHEDITLNQKLFQLKESNASIGESFRNFIYTDKDLLLELLDNWNGSTLNDSDRIINHYDRDGSFSRGPRGGAIKSNESMRSFFEWLYSDEPFNPNKFAVDDEWTNTVNKGRAIAGLGAKEFKQATDDEARGFFQISPDRKVNIGLLKDANLSTFIHENGHWYLEVLKDLSNPGALEKVRQFMGVGEFKAEGLLQIKEDAAKLGNWLDGRKSLKGEAAINAAIEEVGKRKFNQRAKEFDTREEAAAAVLSEAKLDLSKVSVEQHEKFARGIELYFMEGKAPSEELRPVFARIRAWMLAVYQTAERLHVKLNDEVRMVFDRMFATDEAIKSASEESNIAPIFTDAKSSGMSETRFAAYRATIARASANAQQELQQKLMREYQREQTKVWKDRRNEMENEVTQEVDAQKDRWALKILRDNKGGLDKAALEEMYVSVPYTLVGKEVAPGADIMLKLKQLDAYRVKDGIHPDMAAEALGYSSGDELVRALVALPDRMQQIKELTDSRMKEKYGDMLIDGSIADEARKAVLGPLRGDVIEAEIAALKELRSKAAPVVKAVEREAKDAQRAGVSKIRDTIPPLSMVREIAHNTISQLKIRQVNPNVYLVAMRRASHKAIELAAKDDYNGAISAKVQEMLNLELYREAQRVQDTTRKIADYMQGFRKAAARERLGKAGGGYLEQIDSILERFNFAPMSESSMQRKQSLAQWIAEQQKNNLPVNLPENVINEAFRRPYKDLTPEELTGIYDGVRMIAHLASLKNKLLKSSRARDLAEAVNELSATITMNARKPGSNSKIETHLPQDAGTRFIDGFFASSRKIASLVREMDGLVDGGPVWDLIMRPINEAANKEALMHEKANKDLAKLFERYVTFDEKAKRLANAVTFGRVEKGIYHLEHIPEIGKSMSKVGRIMTALNWGNEGNKQRLMDGNGWKPHQVEAILSALTHDDWKFVQGVWDMLESYWPEVEALSVRVDGVSPAKVVRSTVHTPFGELPGGYFPAVYDSRRSPRAYADAAKQAAERAMNGAAVRATTAHGFREARSEGVKRPIKLDFEVIFNHMNELIHDLSHYEMLIDQNRLLGSKTTQAAILDSFGHEVYSQFRSALHDIAAGDVPAQTMVDKSLEWSRQGVSIAAMGWNIMTGLTQAFGLTQSMARVGVVPVAKGMARWMRDAASLENSVKWVHEKSDLMRLRSKTQMREINEIRNQVAEQSLLSPVQDSYFWLITRGQMITDIPTWLGSYEKFMAETKGDEPKAIAMADQVVLDAQGGGQIKDLARVQRGGPLLKLWTNFYSFFNATLNQTAESYCGTDFHKPKDVGRFAVDMLLLYTLPVIMGVAMKELIRGDSGGDKDKILKKLAQEQISYLLGTMLLARETAGAFAGYHDYQGPAGTRIFSSIGKLVKQGGQGEYDKAAWHAANEVAGTLLHYPSGQIQKTVDGFVALKEGQSSNPLVLMSGPPPKQ